MTIDPIWYEQPLDDRIMVPRRLMPQVEPHDLNALIHFVRSKGVWVLKRVVKPAHLRHHQSVNWDPSRYREPPRYYPPVVADDLFILDGNHRVEADFRLKRQSRIIQIGLPFEPAIKLLFEFPKTHKGEV
jgi:hypothetical protein